jgi:predicted CXXCH cytochrome family protein
VCSDCHGAHDILAASDPASRVYPLNVPRTCGRCHGDSTRTGRAPGATVLDQYLSSVHARALLDQSNARAPTCVSCHGVHGAAPPAVGDIDKVCGQCHTAERRYFVAGPHHSGFVRAGLPQCASCHGTHAIAAARPERLATTCVECHKAGAGPQRQLGGKLWTEYRTAAAELEKAVGLTAQAEAVPLNTEDYRARLEEARTYLSEALPAAHSVREEVAAAFAARSRSVSREVESEIYAKLQELRTRKIVLIVFWFYLLLTILILRRFQKGEAKA